MVSIHFKILALDYSITNNVIRYLLAKNQFSWCSLNPKDLYSEITKFARSGIRPSVWPSFFSLVIVLHPTDALHMDIAITFHVAVSISTYFLQSHDRVHVFFTIYVIMLFCTSPFTRSQYFAGPGFEPWTMQDLIFMGPGFNSRARMPVSGQVNPWPMSLAPTIGGSGCFAEK